MEFEYWETEEYQNWCNENCSCPHKKQWVPDYIGSPCNYCQGRHDEQFKQEYWHLFGDEKSDHKEYIN